MVGDLINFRGLVYSPVSEQGVVFLFGKLIEDLNMYIEEIRTAYPDCIGRRFTGKGWEKVYIEFEYLSSNFRQHGHNPDECNIVVCWEHDWKECPIEVIELKEVIKELPTKPIERPDDTSTVEYYMEHHYKRKKLSKEVIELYNNFDKLIKGTDENIWRKIGKTKVTYYCPERVFVYVAFKRNSLLLTVFTGGNELEKVKNVSGRRWGHIKVNSEKDLENLTDIIKRSFSLIKQAIKNNERTTGLLSEIEAEESEEEEE